MALAFRTENFPERIFQPRQVGSNRVPHDLRIDTIVSMPEPVADAANIPPWKSLIEPLSLVAEANRGLADHKHLAFNCSLCFKIAKIFAELHRGNELLNEQNAVPHILQMLPCVIKRQESPRGWPANAQVLSSHRRGPDLP